MFAYLDPILAEPEKFTCSVLGIATSLKTTLNNDS
jgi:hypothetical protein